MLRILTTICVLSTTYGYLLHGNDTVQSRLDMLELLLTEEKQLRMNLETKVTDLTQTVNTIQDKECSCESGNLERPAFMAGLTTDLAHCSVGQPVIFQSVKVNVGNGYNEVHGLFTAPVSGTYVFAASLTAQPHSQYHVALVKNNATNEIGYLYTDPSDIWLGRSTTVLTHMEAGDEMWMVCLADSRIEGDHSHSWGGAGDFHSHMSGFLVSDESDISRR